MQRGVMVAEAGLMAAEIQRERRWRTVEQKRRIVEETLVEGTSVSQVARRHGVNANQVFQWRRQYRAGEYGAKSQGSAGLLTVTVVEPPEDAVEQAQAAHSGGDAIHIELPGRVLVSIERGADRATVRAVLESLRS